MVHAEQGVGIEPVQVDGALPRRRARQVPPQVQQVSTFIWLHTVFFKLRLEIGELVASASRQFEHGLRFWFCFYGLDNREHVDVGGHFIDVEDPKLNVGKLYSALFADVNEPTTITLEPAIELK